MRFVVVSVFFVLSAFSGGCAPLNASTAISETGDRLGEAQRQGAEKYARYEYHKAAAFLAEAKIKNGYGEYQQASMYAREAGRLAEAARQTASRRRELEMRRLRGKARRLRKPPRRRPLVPPGAKRRPKTTPKGGESPATGTAPGNGTPKRRIILPPGLTPPSRGGQ